MKKVTLENNSLTQRASIASSRRSGRPRFKWVDENCKYAYSDLKLGNELEDFDPDKKEHVEKIKKAAMDRKF